jgi:hypothetical protein
VSKVVIGKVFRTKDLVVLLAAEIPDLDSVCCWRDFWGLDTRRGCSRPGPVSHRLRMAVCDDGHSADVMNGGKRC